MLAKNKLLNMGRNQRVSASKDHLWRLEIISSRWQVQDGHLYRIRAVDFERRMQGRGYEEKGLLRRPTSKSCIGLHEIR